MMNQSVDFQSYVLDYLVDKPLAWRIMMVVLYLVSELVCLSSKGMTLEEIDLYSDILTLSAASGEK